MLALKIINFINSWVSEKQDFNCCLQQIYFGFLKKNSADHFQIILRKKNFNSQINRLIVDFSRQISYQIVDFKFRMNFQKMYFNFLKMVFSFQKK